MKGKEKHRVTNIKNRVKGKEKHRVTNKSHRVKEKDIGEDLSHSIRAPFIGCQYEQLGSR